MGYINFLREYSKEIAHLLIILKCSVYLDRSYAEFNFGVGLDRYVGIFIMFRIRQTRHLHPEVTVFVVVDSLLLIYLHT